MAYLDAIYHKNRQFDELNVHKEELEDTTGVIRIRISKKNRQHNDQKKKYKRTNTIYKAYTEN
jgi:hypothetical protein